MPGLPEHMYCSQQINIPPTFPFILRQYAKAAIRTQPTDLLRWSASYFRALSNKIEPPTKVRLEYPIPVNYMGLTPGFIRVLLKQMGEVQTVKWSVLSYKWDGICLKYHDLVTLLLTGKFDDPKVIPWSKFIAVCAGYLNDNLTNTMIMLCNLFTEEPEGGSAMISIELFLTMYKFLADLDCSKPCKSVNEKFFLPHTEVAVCDMFNHPPGYQKESFVKIARQADPHLTENFSMVSAIPFEFEHFANKNPSVHEDNALSTTIGQSVSEILSGAGSTGFKVADKIASVNISQISSTIASNPDEKRKLSIEDRASSSSSSSDDAESEASKKEYSERSSAFIPPDDLLATCETDVERESITLPHSEYLPLESTLIEPSGRLGKVSSHVHLNKFLQSSEPSMTINGSQFTVPPGTSETNTIFRASEIFGKFGEQKPTHFLDVPTEYDIPIVKGIGPAVNPDVRNTFVKHIKEIASKQHGMVMPRNINHFMCPPMENFDEEIEKNNSEYDDACYSKKDEEIN